MKSTIKHSLTILFFGLFYSIFAQPLLSDLQKFTPETIKKNKIKSITTYEKNYDKPFYDYKSIIIPDSSTLAETNKLGVRQSLEEYDTLGRITKRKNFWEYSDAGLVTQNFLWNETHHISAIEHLKDSILERKEEFFYDMVGNMILWKVTVYSENMVLFKKYEHNIKGEPVKIKIFIGKDLVRSDSIAYKYDVEGNIIEERGFDMYKANMDSIAYAHNQGDTLFVQEIFVRGKRDKTNLHKKNRLYTTRKFTTFSDGDFMGTSYAIYNKSGNISKEKSIHHYSQLNYTKEYIYSHTDLPMLKRIYKNKKDPEVLVNFDIDFYADENETSEN